MSLLNRNTLKNFFKKGSFPTEVHFADMIDSMVNKLDDGFAKTSKEGLLLSPIGSSKKVLSFYESLRDRKAAFEITINPDKNSKGLSIGRSDKSYFFIKNDGKVGVGTTLPKYALEVNGIAGFDGRIGTHKVGEIPGDGRWHPILENLDGMQAFEIMAQISGEKGRGKYALTQATAISTFGRSSSRIKQTRAYYGWFWNRISLRWRGSLNNYRLEMRTGSNYGFDKNEKQRVIRFFVSRLWDSELDQFIQERVKEDKVAIL